MEQRLYDLMDWPNIEGIIYSDLTNPKSLLGSHAVEDGLLIQSFYPNAVKATIKAANGKEYPMELADEAGYFAALLPVKNKFEYTVVYEFADGNTYEMYNAYEVPSMLKKKDIKAFNEGNCSDAYNFMGAHIGEYKGRKGVNFAVWAPFALRVSVVGTFNNWDGRVHQMERIDDSGIFELFVPDAKPGDMYKFEIRFKGGELHSKSDPYGFAAELRPGTASIIYDDKAYVWKDSAWIEGRDKAQYKNSPFAVYEVHLGSFMKPDDGRTFLNYRELAPLIIKHVKEQKFPHVELMPVMEHPLDESWGYQVTGYYAPTSRYGNPAELMEFIDVMPCAGIGVILDWVPAHFPKDAHGLAAFDGTCLYEHLDPRQGENTKMGTLVYNYGRLQVSNFLISNALYWAKEFHVDGIRAASVDSMLYLDYGKHSGEWIANMYGGHENLDAVEFIKHLNSIFHKEVQGAIMIAEESTAWPRITGDLKEEGLGFDYKWNSGWQNDFLHYMKCEPQDRHLHYGDLTLGMLYAYSEDYVQGFSHAEVVHGKGSMYAKMPGDSADKKMANLRAVYGYLLGHPGKKHLFMGQEFGQTTEWSEANSLDWALAKEKKHVELQTFIKAINRLYTTQPALYARDYEPEGFEWVNCTSDKDNVIVFDRSSEKPEETLVFVCNFAASSHEEFRFGVPFAGTYKEILNSDAVEFGGTGQVNAQIKVSAPIEKDNRKNSITVRLAPMSVCVFAGTPEVRTEVVTEEDVPEPMEEAGGSLGTVLDRISEKVGKLMKKK